MEKPPVEPFDWQRLFLGQEHWGFYGEIALRSLFMYLLLLLLLRLLSKRTLSELSILEFGLVIILGSAAGDPTFYPEIPLLHGAVVLAVVVAAQRVYTSLLRHSETIETAMEGVPIEIIQDGRIVKNALHKATLAQEELFELLRIKGIRQLGEVERAYVEQNGQLSIFCFQEKRSGLPIVPPWDISKPFEHCKGERVAIAQILACCHCGQLTEPGECPESCQNCQHQEFMYACLNPLKPEPPLKPESSN